jgi:GNAT superfamily N-acetyltransferase
VTAVYRINNAEPLEITQHLLACDVSFHPSLSSRVNLVDYALKLAQNAVRFEAWLDSRLIGLVAVYCNADDCGTAFVSNVSVDPEFTGRGIARQLMQTCIAYVQNLNFKRLSLWIDPAALPAMRLYQALGFVPETGRSPARQGMCLELDLRLP